MNVEPDSQVPAAADSELSIIETVRKRQMQERQRVWHPEQVRPSNALAVAHDPRHPRSEAIRALRTKLLLARDRSRHSGAIAVLSACPTEGRTQLCAELAISFAQSGRQTLLVDADLRAPRQHLLFGAHNQSGLAQALSQGEPPRPYGVQGIPHLALLTSGGAPMNPLELLCSDRFEHLVGAWQHEYEFVLIDTPPVTRYADGITVASVTRRVLIVCRSPVTSFKDVKEMTRHLSAAPTQVVGAVINKF